MSSGEAVHRAGALKQTNKPFKSGRHRSQHEIKKTNKGRINAVSKHSKSLKRLGTSSKQDRANTALQLRKKKKEMSEQQRQAIGSIDGVPQLITVIPLSSDVDSFSVVQLLTSCTNDKKAADVATSCGARLYTSPKTRSKFCFLSPNRENLEHCLDATRMTDTVLYVVSASSGISLEGDYLLDLINGHCSPSSIIYSVVSSSSSDQLSTTSTASSIRNIEKILEKRFLNAKLFALDTEQDAQRLLRKFAEQKLTVPTKRCLRPYFFADKIEYEQPDTTMRSQLKLSGYLRGTNLSVNGLIDIPGLGTFQMDKIELVKFERGYDGLIHPLVQSTLTPEVEKQTSLQAEAEPDELETGAEQTWPTQEELEQAQTERHQVKKRVPKGTSEYQAAWIISDDEEESVNNEEEHMKTDDLDHEDKEPEDEEEEEEEEMDELVINANGYDDKMDLEENEETLAKVKAAAKLDEQFPDEIDTPLHMPARVRFQKYRGLKSFRTTKWDVKENLPLDYGRIYQFPHFRSMVRQVQEQQQNKNEELDSNTTAKVNSYVNVYLKDVPVVRFEPGHHVIATGLLPYEQCLSVLNIVLHRTVDSEQVLKSKERLILHVGQRRFASSPIYSQHSNGDKHKFERFFRPRQTLVATCYGPITYPPASVLAFKEYSDGRQELVATGSLLSVNPDRLVVKRLVLSGHPLKIHKKSAVVRYMFFNPEDINWFKPIELRTRWGRRGHIKESLGTHGHMKCQFDGILKSQDTILMNLYKRVYPKWTYEPLTPAAAATKKEEDDEKMQ